MTFAKRSVCTTGVCQLLASLMAERSVVGLGWGEGVHFVLIRFVFFCNGGQELGLELYTRTHSHMKYKQIFSPFCVCSFWSVRLVYV